jgi:hypothetical protein
VLSKTETGGMNAFGEAVPFWIKVANVYRHSRLKPTQFAKAQCHTIHLKLLKIGALVRLSVRRICVNLSSAYL